MKQAICPASLVGTYLVLPTQVKYLPGYLVVQYLVPPEVRPVEQEAAKHQQVYDDGGGIAKRKSIVYDVTNETVVIWTSYFYLTWYLNIYFNYHRTVCTW